MWRACLVPGSACSPMRTERRITVCDCQQVRLSVVPTIPFQRHDADQCHVIRGLCGVTRCGGLPPSHLGLAVRKCTGEKLAPPDATVESYLQLRGQLGLERSVLVQPSTHGFDRHGVGRN
jgi:hypothetical protein